MRTWIRHRTPSLPTTLQALLVGFLLTIACAAFGFAYHDGRFFWTPNAHIPPTGGEGSFFTGWFVDESGEVQRYTELANVYMRRPGGTWRRDLAASMAGRGHQNTYYGQFFRGFPFFWLSYFETAYPPHGFHGDADSRDLEVYPRLKFGAILWGGLVGDLAVWSAVMLVILSVPQWVRLYRHRRRGLCTHCGYNLHGLTSSRCPECGTEFDAGLLHEDFLARADSPEADDVDLTRPDHAATPLQIGDTTPVARVSEPQRPH